MHILIIEDEENLSKLLSDRLRGEGFEVAVAADGVAGLAAAKEQKPDLVLLDIVIPRLDGMTLLRRMRAESWGSDIPVIMFTNLADDEKKIEAKALGASFLIKSDLDLGEVVTNVQLILGQAGKAGSV
ncbi:MAG: hypothetical protein A2722_01330 [Candidatus Doudnabacteria bacterium RIFCSPHIGHO2_01_FULL_50_11]|uniref:Response regulatory domain-containing protein n=1 Tax=Candidatus Doudnabacteria bacterium RIFCSPHIGHO2_01_FULL_50_11 TaxID=1817828 RepID=A0A1F5PH92_9BACT|nr:MAG: hypothetical protein A2722_01330 [Candidatus Doudnabacteria bacterium RIFCSPHIGHO2_01_FULL_50_11]